ncbi:hypothetical protein GGR53DRAFT_188202 [Hypoxylon sp. FL1150]|nr:hypothetical protein GGR53DRAFT_188202 [Hypoxylon sp. FL1150]
MQHSDLHSDLHGPPQPSQQHHRTSHSFGQHHSTTSQGAMLHQPQGAPRHASHSSTYRHKSTVSLTPMGPIPNGMPGFCVPALAASSYPKKTSKQHHARPLPLPISSIPERLVPSEPESMTTKSPSTNCITPAIRTESVSGVEFPQSSGSNEAQEGTPKAATPRVIIPSDSSTSSGGYRTPPENPEPKSAGLKSENESQIKLDEEEGEIDYGTVIRRRPRPHLRVPSGWGKQDSSTMKQPGERKNSKLQIQTLGDNDVQSLGSRDSSAEYVPALAYQPESRHSSGEKAPGQQHAGKKNSTRSSSFKSAKPSDNEAKPEVTPAHDHDEATDTSAKLIDSAIRGNSTLGVHKPPKDGQVNQPTPQPELDQQHTRERLATLDTVVFSPCPVTHIADPVSTIANTVSTTAKMSANWSGQEGHTPSGTPPNTKSSKPFGSGKPAGSDQSAGSHDPGKSAGSSRASSNQLNVREWLNANPRSDTSESPTDPAAFSHQFNEVDTAVESHRRRDSPPIAQGTYLGPKDISTYGACKVTSQWVSPPAPKAFSSKAPNSVVTEPGVHGANPSPTPAASLFSKPRRDASSPARHSPEPFPAYADPMNNCKVDRWNSHPTAPAPAPPLAYHQPYPLSSQYLSNVLSSYPPHFHLSYNGNVYPQMPTGALAPQQTRYTQAPPSTPFKIPARPPAHYETSKPPASAPRRKSKATKVPQGELLESTRNPLNPLAKEFRLTSSAASRTGSVNGGSKMVVGRNQKFGDYNDVGDIKYGKAAQNGGKDGKRYAGVPPDDDLVAAVKNLAMKDVVKGVSKTAGKKVGTKKVGASTDQKTTNASPVQPDKPKTSPNGNENASPIHQPGKKNNLANIKVAIPLNFANIQQHGSQGRATTCPTLQQPPLQSQPNSAPPSPPRDGEKSQSHTPTQKQNQSQQMTPEQRTPQCSPKTPRAEFKQLTTPYTSESTIPVLSSSDTPRSQARESRPTINAWSQGPPQLNRSPSQPEKSCGSGMNAQSNGDS